MFYEDFNKEHHAGIVMLERGLSEPCMTLWQQKFKENPHVKSDQRFLKMIFHDAKQSICGILTLNRHDHLLLPMPRDLRQNQVSKTFVHFTSYSVVRIKAELQKRYLSKVLNISKDPGSEYLAEVSHF